MAECEDQSAALESIVARFADGDDAALNELLVRVAGRFERLARTMLDDFPRVRRWEDTSDIVQNVAVRLFRTFQSTRPRTVRGFFALAALQIRRELIDLARHYYGPEGSGANHASHSGGPERQAEQYAEGSASHDPDRLAAWTEFHEQASQLQEELREVFDLLYYQGLSQIEAAQVLGISDRTLRRRWDAVRQLFKEVLDIHGVV